MLGLLVVYRKLQCKLRDIFLSNSLHVFVLAARLHLSARKGLVWTGRLTYRARFSCYALGHE